MGPIFLLAGGGRTGSTLVQRLLLSTRQVLVWGEHRGVLLKALGQILQTVKEVLSQDQGQSRWDQFLKTGPNSWVANINPSTLAYFSACREFLDHALGRSARDLGYPRWGFKEVHYGAMAALFLQDLFPDACFAFLVRNPCACLRSIKAASWYGAIHGADPARFLGTWARLSTELVQVGPRLKRACLLRYEDVLARPGPALGVLAAATGIPEHLFDRAVLDHVERGQTGPPAPLDDRDRQALSDRDVRAAAQLLGYTIEGAHNG